MSDATAHDLSSAFHGYAREFASEVVNELKKQFSIRLPALLSAREVAGILGISERQVWRMVSAGELPAPKRVGTLTKWRRSEIEAWVED